MNTELDTFSHYIQQATDLSEEEKTTVIEAAQTLSETALTFLVKVFQDDPEFISVFAQNLLQKKAAFANDDNELFATILEAEQFDCA